MTQIGAWIDDSRGPSGKRVSKMAQRKKQARSLGDAEGIRSEYERRLKQTRSAYVVPTVAPVKISKRDFEHGAMRPVYRAPKRVTPTHERPSEIIQENGPVTLAPIDQYRSKYGRSSRADQTPIAIGDRRVKPLGLNATQEYDTLI